MLDSITSNSSFMPHGHCFLWDPYLLWLHVGSDTLTTLAYFSIPVALYYFQSRRTDLQYRSLFLLFAAFILFCGLTHLFGIWNMWHSDYWASGSVKFATGVISMVTAVMLWRWMPIALAWPGRAQLEQANLQLEHQILLREQTNRNLRDSNRLLEEAFDNAPIGKALVAPDGRWLRTNTALTEILGYTQEELVRTDFQSITHPDDLAPDLEHVRRLVDGVVDSYQMEKRYFHKTGRLVWCLLSVTLVRDEDQEPRYFIAQILDITDQKAAEAELKMARDDLERRVTIRTRELAEANIKLEEVNRKLSTMVRHDSLTGLVNRMALMEALEELIQEARRYRTPWSLMLIDIDRFKSINDTYGHVAGDRAIAMVGEVIGDTFRATDITARLGGDEFCIAERHATLEDALKSAAKLRDSIREQTVGNDQDPFGVTISIGVVQWEPGMNTVEEVIDRADKALYEAKEAGRDSIGVAS